MMILPISDYNQQKSAQPPGYSCVFRTRYVDTDHVILQHWDLKLAATFTVHSDLANYFDLNSFSFVFLPSYFLFTMLASFWHMTYLHRSPFWIFADPNNLQKLKNASCNAKISTERLMREKVVTSSWRIFLCIFPRKNVLSRANASSFPSCQ